jgi:hypothetical protein
MQSALFGEVSWKERKKGSKITALISIFWNLLKKLFLALSEAFQAPA